MFKKTLLASALISCSLVSFAASKAFIQFEDLPKSYSALYNGHDIVDTPKKFPLLLSHSDDKLVIHAANNDWAEYDVSYKIINGVPKLIVQYAQGVSTHSSMIGVNIASQDNINRSHCIAASHDKKASLNLNAKGDIAVVSVTHGCPSSSSQSNMLTTVPGGPPGMGGKW